jgi:hypothetical protein
MRFRLALPRLLLATVVACGVLIGFSNAAGAVPVPWTNCGHVGDPISFQEFVASVWPPQGGEPETFLNRWTLAENINHGAYDMVTETLPSGTVRYRTPFVLFPPLPSALFPPVTKPPIALGPHLDTFTFTVPQLPAGSVYGFHIVGFNNDATRLFCMDVNVPIK